MSEYRIETDSLGEMKIPNDVYYGIYTMRALENFDINDETVNLNIIYAMVEVKKAAAMAHKRLKTYEVEKADAIINACDDILIGIYDDEFKLNPYQGGAGTSINMNVNEVIANVALEHLGHKLGKYDVIHPINHVNNSQSTNDVFPTASRIAAIKELRKLAEEYSKLQEAFQKKENEFADIIKLGRTQLMDALPITVGQQFGAYSKAIARDRWRIYKVEERIRTINLGGTAVGTGLNADIKYIFLVTELIQEITGLGLSRSEFLMDVTQNMDVYVEVSGLLKSAAVNLIKITNDLRLLSMGPKGGLGEVILPKVQVGSSIMPGKVNPVILEMVNQVAMKVIGNDAIITNASQSGLLELNPFGPIIIESLLDSLILLNGAIYKLRKKVIDNIDIDKDKCLEHLENSTALATALVHHIGYDKASDVAKKSLSENKTIKQVVLELELIEEEKIEEILNPIQLVKPGIPGGK